LLRRKSGFSVRPAKIAVMTAVGPKHWNAIDACTLEADLAFFEARLALASGEPDTAYQRAQIKTYRALGKLLGGRLEEQRRSRTPASAA